MASENVFSLAEEMGWWAFERVVCLAKRIWGYMWVDVDSVRPQIDKQEFEDQPKIETRAATLFKKSPKQSDRRLESRCPRISILIAFCKVDGRVFADRK